MIRAFLALPLPDPILHRLGMVQHILRLDHAVPRESLHLTLAFLGEQPKTQLEELHHVLTARTLPVPALQLDGLGVFGGDTPRSLHARFAPDPRLLALQARVAQSVRDAGIVLERRRFIPHVTLARFTRGEVSAQTLAAGFAAVGALTSQPLVPDHLVLFRSTLRRDGAIYDALAEYPLTG
jgi:2'-5' RNA ligase